MGVFRVQRIIHPKSGITRDQTVNTFHFQTPLQNTASPTETEMGYVKDALDALFNEPVGANNALRFYLAEATMAQQRSSYKFYNMDHPIQRQPLGGPHLGLNNSAANEHTPLPSEVALCLSFRGANESGTIPARRRGRVFIGPLNVNCVEADPITGQARPSLGIQNSLLAGANRLADSMALVGMIWSVYSPSLRAVSESGSALSGTTDIEHVWIDNAFDTQRRRGQAASARVAQDV